MKKSVKIIIAVAVVLVLAIGGVVGGVLYNNAQNEKAEKAIAEEVAALTAIEEDEDIEDDEYSKKVNEILGRKVVEKGKYAEVEECIKSYLDEYYYSGVTDAIDIFEGDAFVFEKVVHEGKDFTDAKKTIADAKASLKKSIDNYTSFLDEKNADEYIADKGFNDKQTEIFKNAIKEIQKCETKETSDAYIEMLEAAIDVLVESEDVIAFLEEHPYVDDNGVPTFETTEEVVEFQTLIGDYIDAATKMGEIAENA